MSTAQWALVIGSVFGPGGLALALAAYLHSLATKRSTEAAQHAALITQQTALESAIAAHTRIDALGGGRPHSAP